MRVAKSSKNRFALYAIKCMILKEYKYYLSLASCPVKKTCLHMLPVIFSGLANSHLLWLEVVYMIIGFNISPIQKGRIVFDTTKRAGILPRSFYHEYKISTYYRKRNIIYRRAN